MGENKSHLMKVLTDNNVADIGTSVFDNDWITRCRKFRDVSDPTEKCDDFLLSEGYITVRLERVSMTNKVSK